MSLLGFLKGNMGKGLFTEEEMTQWQLHHQDPPQYKWQYIKAGTLRYTEQHAGSSVDILSKWLSWFAPLPGSLEALFSFLVASLVSESSLKLGSSESDLISS